jgi:protein-ribulosamine 3-kinase
MEVLKSHIEGILNTSIISFIPLSGGDISAVSKINTKTETYVLKYGRQDHAALFEAESKGLTLIADTKTIATPHVFASGVYNETAYLLLKFIESKSPEADDFARLGTQLAELHDCHSDNFGLSTNNFIGALPQKNDPENTWIDFYSRYRLSYQFELARNKGLLSPSEIPANENIKSVLKSFALNIQPSLLHGDLWSGNYLIARDGTPYLIDPAVYYGHAEVDIAMSLLFGGFGPAFYETYHQHRPKTTFFKERIELYQLYYLLVHLNLFGRSYYHSVKTILGSYF